VMQRREYGEGEERKEEREKREKKAGKEIKEIKKSGGKRRDYKNRGI
jgi:hypothetical protein